MLRYVILEEHPESPKQLFGATLGQTHMLGLRSRLSGAESGHLVLIDFSGVEAASASYLKATVLTLLNDAIAAVEDAELKTLTDAEASGPAIVPVVAGLSAEIAEEFDTLLLARRLPLLEATRTTADTVLAARVRGFLEPAPKETLGLVVQHRAVTATQLAGIRAPPNATGWSNRLADLYRLRLLNRVKEGRHWRYSPVCSEVTLG